MAFFNCQNMIHFLIVFNRQNMIKYNQIRLYFVAVFNRIIFSFLTKIPTIRIFLSHLSKTVCDKCNSDGFLNRQKCHL